MRLVEILCENGGKKYSRRYINQLYSSYTSQIGIDVDGGNCGQYALAMSEFLHSKHGIETEIWFIAPNPTKDNNREEGYRDCGDFSVDEFENGDIYHVFLEYNDFPVGISIAGLRKTAAVQYNDEDPCFHGSSRNDPAIIRIIDNDTDWSVHRSKFYKMLKSSTVAERH